MSIKGSCQCHNIKVTWYCADYSMTPRACQCSYCLSKGAAYVSKSGTRFEVFINDKTQHSIVKQGSNTAIFHECSNCKDIVCVTSEIKSETYGALNANCLVNKFGFAESIETNFDGQSKEEKIERWKNNWCIVSFK